jgi:hypothetical protein
MQSTFSSTYHLVHKGKMISACYHKRNLQVNQIGSGSNLLDEESCHIKKLENPKPVDLVIASNFYLVSMKNAAKLIKFHR